MALGQTSIYIAALFNSLIKVLAFLVQGLYHFSTIGK